jgi:hypothetical protein
MKDITCMLAMTGFLYSDWSLVKFIYKTFGVGHSLKDRCICFPCVVSDVGMKLILFWMLASKHLLCIICMP